MRPLFERDALGEWKANAAEVGRVGVIVSAVTAAVVVIAESFRPGVVGAVIPLETALAATALFVALTFLAPAEPRPRYAALTVLSALAAAAVAAKAAWIVFAPEGSLRPWFVAAAALTAAVIISAARHSEH